MLAWSPAGEAGRPRVLRAAVAAGVLATTPGWIGWGRTSTTDMFLASAISLSLFAFLLTHRHPPHPWLAPLGRVADGAVRGHRRAGQGAGGSAASRAWWWWSSCCSPARWRPWLRWRPLSAMVALFLGVSVPGMRRRRPPTAMTSSVASSVSATCSGSPPCSTTTPAPPGSICPGWCCWCCPGRSSCPRRSRPRGSGVVRPGARRQAAASTARQARRTWACSWCSGWC